MPGLSCVYYALPKQNKLNRKRHRHCHGMHGQYNLPESRIFRFSIPANAGASPPWTPHKGRCPLESRRGLMQPPDPPARLVTPLSFTNYLLQQKKTRTLHSNDRIEIDVSPRSNCVGLITVVPYEYSITLKIYMLCLCDKDFNPIPKNWNCKWGWEHFCEECHGQLIWHHGYYPLCKSKAKLCFTDYVHGMWMLLLVIAGTVNSH